MRKSVLQYYKAKILKAGLHPSTGRFAQRLGFKALHYPLLIYPYPFPPFFPTSLPFLPLLQSSTMVGLTGKILEFASPKKLKNQPTIDHFRRETLSNTIVSSVNILNQHKLTSMSILTLSKINYTFLDPRSQRAGPYKFGAVIVNV